MDTASPQRHKEGTKDTKNGGILRGVYPEQRGGLGMTDKDDRIRNE